MKAAKIRCDKCNNVLGYELDDGVDGSITMLCTLCYAIVDRDK